MGCQLPAELLPQMTGRRWCLTVPAWCTAIAQSDEARRACIIPATQEINHRAPAPVAPSHTWLPGKARSSWAEGATLTPPPSLHQAWGWEQINGNIHPKGVTCKNPKLSAQKPITPKPAGLCSYCSSLLRAAKPFWDPIPPHVSLMVLFGARKDRQ